MSEESSKTEESLQRQDPIKNQEHEQQLMIRVQQHSMIIYWWPVWLLGIVFAIMSFVGGQQIEIEEQTMWFYPSRNMGVIFLTVFVIVFSFTNIAFRGLASLLVAMALLIIVLVCSLLGVWDSLFSLEQHLSVHMDGGFYLFVSLFVFAAWSSTLFFFDRFTYCEFRPGQMIVRNIIGGGSRTFDTRGMAVYKLQDDPLRHWLLGFGTGDLHIATTGAESMTIEVRNVAFIDRKLQIIKELVAMAPDTDPKH